MRLSKIFKWLFIIIGIIFAFIIAWHFLGDYLGAESIPDHRGIAWNVGVELTAQMDLWEGETLTKLVWYWGTPDSEVKYEGKIVYLYFEEDKSRVFWSKNNIIY